MALAPVLLLASFAIAMFMTPAFMVTLLLLRRPDDILLVADQGDCHPRCRRPGGSVYDSRHRRGSAATGVPASPLAPGVLPLLLLLQPGDGEAPTPSWTRSGRGKTDRRRRAGYYASDRPEIATWGPRVATSRSSSWRSTSTARPVVVLYRQPLVLWLISPLLLYWISRVWLAGGTAGEMHEDPVVFADPRPRELRRRGRRGDRPVRRARRRVFSRRWIPSRGPMEAARAGVVVVCAEVSQWSTFLTSARCTMNSDVGKAEFDY